MASQTRLTVIKRMTYRGNAQEEWSNSYSLDGTPPANDAAWRTLFDELVAAEKGCYNSGSSVIGGYGYNDDSDNAHAVWTVDLTISPNTPVPGTLSSTAGLDVPGDVAAWARWGLDRFNSKGKRVYLRKYFHSVMMKSTPPYDECSAATKTALAAFATTMKNGLPGGRKIIDRKHTDANVVSAGGSTYLTTRTLKRRGKRP